mgnify:CR=1 FL=1
MLNLVRKADVSLLHRPSSLAAASLLAAINVSLSPKLSLLMGIECLNLEIFVKEAGALAWWTVDVEIASFVTKEELKMVYTSVLKSLDKFLLGGIL